MRLNGLTTFSIVACTGNMVNMKKDNKKSVYLLLLLIVGLMIALFVYSVNITKKDYFVSIGKQAMNFSLITSDNVNLSNSEVERLIALDFEELLEDETNIVFENQTRRLMRSLDIKYIYMIHQLDDKQTRYLVTDEDEEDFGLPAGTRLNTIYLLDSVVDIETRLKDTDYQGYTDKDRYTYLQEEIQQIYDKREPDYLFYKDKWGTYITGFSPVYSTEGNYIGMLGADIYISEYTNFVDQRGIFLVVFCLLILILICAMLRTYKKNLLIEAIVDNLNSKVYYDEITGLYNRTMLKEQKDRYRDFSIEKETTVAALMIDIDSFKGINDKYGHLKGDEIITTISHIIKSELQGNGQAFRYGGDELMILFLNNELDEIQAIAERIRSKVNKISFPDIKEEITVSIGIAFKDQNREIDFITLMKNADDMMYMSKEKGGNCVSLYNV